MRIENTSDQRVQFVARVGNGRPVELDLARSGAPAAWEQMPAATRGDRPEVALDLDAAAKGAGVESRALLAALEQDALFRALKARGQIRVS